MKLRKIIPFITTGLIMLAIFMFSAQTSEESSAVSRGFTRQFVEWLSTFISISPQKQLEIMQGIHNIVRKMAHFSIYGALGVSSTAMFLTIKPNSKRYLIVIYSVLFCFLYAVTDELHQNFVSGRGPKLMDVAIDTAGAFCGSCLLFIVIIICRYIKTRLGSKRR